MLHASLISSYIMLQLTFGPFKINSGYRTVAHNKRVGGVPNSRHIHGKALDISTRGLDMREKGDLYRKANMYFDIVIIYKSHIHVHIK